MSRKKRQFVINSYSNGHISWHEPGKNEYGHLYPANKYSAIGEDYLDDVIDSIVGMFDAPEVEISIIKVARSTFFLIEGTSRHYINCLVNQSFEVNGLIPVRLQYVDKDADRYSAFPDYIGERCKGRLLKWTVDIVKLGKGPIGE